MMVGQRLVWIGVVGVLTGCGSSPAPGHPGAATIVGRVTAGPTCPVERAASPCPDRTVSGASVRAVAHGVVETTTRTNSTGDYRLTVEPGQYTVIATNVGGYPSHAQRWVTVAAGQQATVDLVVDTGIR